MPGSNKLCAACGAFHCRLLFGDVFDNHAIDDDQNACNGASSDLAAGMVGVNAHGDLGSGALWRRNVLRSRVDDIRIEFFPCRFTSESVCMWVLTVVGIDE